MQIFLFLWTCNLPCGILVPWQRMEPLPLTMKARGLKTTGPPGKFSSFFYYLEIICRPRPPPQNKTKQKTNLESKEKRGALTVPREVSLPGSPEPVGPQGPLIPLLFVQLLLVSRAGSEEHTATSLSQGPLLQEGQKVTKPSPAGHNVEEAGGRKV